MTEKRVGGVLPLIAWAKWPASAITLFQILADTRDEELELLMRSTKPGAHIAWAEWGRRKFGTEYGIQDGVAVPQVVYALPSMKLEPHTRRLMN